MLTGCTALARHDQILWIHHSPTPTPLSQCCRHNEWIQKSSPGGETEVMGVVAERCLVSSNQW